MKIKLTKLPHSQVKLEIVISDIVAKEQVDKIVEKYSAHIEIKGFRKGFAPKPMVIDSVGIGRIQQETLENLVNLSYGKAIKEHKVYPIAQPAISVKKFNLSPAGIIDGNVLLEMILDLMPEVKLGDYTRIKIKDKSILKPDLAVTQEEINKVIEHLRRQKSTMEEVKRPVEEGDWVEISFSGKIDKVAHEKLTSKNHPLVIGSKSMVPGFEESVIGMEVAKPKQVKITFPKDYFAKEFAGKIAEFGIELHSVKKIILPKADSEFAKNFGHNELSKFEGAIKKQLEEEKQYVAKQKLESATLEQARKIFKADIPSGLIHQEVDRLIKKLKENIEKQGANFDRYLDSIKKTNESLHKELEPQAVANIEVGLLLGEVIKKEKLDVDNKEAPKVALQKLIDYATK